MERGERREELRVRFVHIGIQSGRAGGAKEIAAGFAGPFFAGSSTGGYGGFWC